MVTDTALWVLALLAALSPAADVSLFAAQPEAWTSWATVNVTWSVPSSTTNDWVGAFVQDWKPTYIHYKNISESSGTMQFRLLNARQPFIFRYYRGDQILATSNPVTPLAETPNQGHLSFVPGRHDAMVISWTSSASANLGVVHWGTNPDALTFSAEATSDTYAAEDFTACMGIPPIPTLNDTFANISEKCLRCTWKGPTACYDDPTSSKLFLDPGALHTAIMQPLAFAPGARVYYTFGDSTGNHRSPVYSSTGIHRSPVYSFVAPRAPEAPGAAAPGAAAPGAAAPGAAAAGAAAVAAAAAGTGAAFTFLVTADMGIGGLDEGQAGGATDNDPPLNGADQVIAAILSDPGTSKDEFMLLNGDISYARGWPWIWERYFDLIQPLATQMPLMVSVGNHEVDSHSMAFRATEGGDSGGECGVVVSKRFPHLKSPSEMWYSFTHGSVHWVVLSTEHPIAVQQEWFKKDVSQLDRTRVPWLLVSMHRPVFLSHDPNNAVVLLLRAAWHGLFEESNVDMVYTGHAHYYERLCPVEVDIRNISNVTCSATRDRPVYIVDGTAGAEFAPLSSPESNLTMYKEFEKWGYSRFFVTPEELTFKHYRSVDHSLADSIALPVRRGERAAV